MPVRKGGALGASPAACSPLVPLQPSSRNQLCLRPQAAKHSTPHATTGHRHPSHLLLVSPKARVGVFAILPQGAGLFFPPESGSKTHTWSGSAQGSREGLEAKWQQVASDATAAALSRSIPQHYGQHGEVTVQPPASPELCHQHARANALLVLLCACPGGQGGLQRNWGLWEEGIQPARQIPSGTKTSCQFQLRSSVAETEGNISLQCHSTEIIAGDFQKPPQQLRLAPAQAEPLSGPLPQPPQTTGNISIQAGLTAGQGGSFRKLICMVGAKQLFGARCSTKPSSFPKCPV